MGQKENLEFHALQNFVSEYNRRHKRELCFVRQCRPPMPDALCRLDGKEIGVEVVHTYGTEAEAAMRLGNRSEEDFPEALHQTRRLVPLDVRAISSLNAVLLDKATKSYSFSPVWLLVRNAFVLWSLTDYRGHKRDIEAPTSHPFSQIWLLCDRNSIGSQGIMKLG